VLSETFIPFIGVAAGAATPRRCPDGLRKGGRISHMNASFEFVAPQRIVFGAGTLAEAAPIVRSFGRHALVVTGGTPGRAEPLLTALRAKGIGCCTFPVRGEPEVHTVRAAVDLARTKGCDVVIGIGGGAALDTAKAVAILSNHQGDVLDYLEIIGLGGSIENPPLPFIAIPTTAGSGAEATWNSVIVSREHRAKVSLRSRLMIARVALVDPELTYELPPDLTAATGMDALAQLLEAYVSLKANPLTDGLCLEGLARAARSLRRAVAAGRDAPAREDMALSGLLGGMVLANAGLGAAHGIAGPLGGMLPAPHGALCAALLPEVVAANLHALGAGGTEGAALFRYRKIATILTGDSEASAAATVDWLRALVKDLGIPGLGAHGLGIEDVPELVAKASRASSMKGNPVQLTDPELTAIIEAAL
jgi:alcohol dehydrogenase class IV